MRNTMKTIIFIISLFVFLFFLIIVNLLVPIEGLLESSDAVHKLAALYISGYLIALYTQAIIKFLYTRKHIKTLKILKSFPAYAFDTRDRLLILALPFIAVILPIVSRRSFNADRLWSLFYLLVLVLVIEILYRLNRKTVKVHIGDKGVAVSGIDFRIELSMPLSYRNAVGFYPYEYIDNYLALNDKIIIYQSYDFGTITINCTGEEMKQIIELLVSKKIPVRKY